MLLCVLRSYARNSPSNDPTPPIHNHNHNQHLRPHHLDGLNLQSTTTRLVASSPTSGFLRETYAPLQPPVPLSIYLVLQSRDEPAKALPVPLLPEPIA